MKFAHQSEKIFANHLDLFDIKWIYEPKSFPLKWGSGAIKMMFTPDFYLPEMDIYIEITTMDQKLSAPYGLPHGGEHLLQRARRAHRLHPARCLPVLHAH